VLLEFKRSQKRTQAHSRGKLNLTDAESWRLPVSNGAVGRAKGGARTDAARQLSGLDSRRDFSEAWALDSAPNTNGAFFPRFSDVTHLASDDRALALESAAALAADLHMLLCAPPHRFWSTVAYSAPLRGAIRSLVEFLPRPWDGDRIGRGDVELSASCDVLQRRLWGILVRLSSPTDGDYTITPDVVTNFVLGLDNQSDGVFPGDLVAGALGLFGFSLDRRQPLRHIVVRFEECARSGSHTGSTSRFREAFESAVVPELVKDLVACADAPSDAERALSVVSRTLSVVSVLPECAHSLLSQGSTRMLNALMTVSSQLTSEVLSTRAKHAFAHLLRHGIFRALLIAGGASSNPRLLWCEQCQQITPERALDLAVARWLSTHADQSFVRDGVSLALESEQSPPGEAALILMESAISQVIGLPEDVRRSVISLVRPDSPEGDDSVENNQVVNVPDEVESAARLVSEVSGAAVGTGAVFLLWLEFQQSGSAHESLQEFALERILEREGSDTPVSVELQFSHAEPARTLDVSLALDLPAACSLLSDRLGTPAADVAGKGFDTPVPEGATVIWREKNITAAEDELEGDDEMIQSILRLSQSELAASFASDATADGEEASYADREDLLYDDEYDDAMDSFGGKNLDLLASTGDGVSGDIGDDVVFVDEHNNNANPNHTRARGGSKKEKLSAGASAFVPQEATSFGRGARLANSSAPSAASGIENGEARESASGRGRGGRGSGSRSNKTVNKPPKQKAGTAAPKGRGGGARGRGARKNAAARKRGLG
jgi:hypothetical protein